MTINENMKRLGNMQRKKAVDDHSWHLYKVFVWLISKIHKAAPEKVGAALLLMT